MADNNANRQNRRVDVKVTADVKEALRSVSQLERQATKLGDLADQGVQRQGGFLSPKQVDMYRKIVKEIETTYSNHYKRLQEMQEQYSRKVEASQRKLATHQEALNRAQGANKWGDVASPSIIAYHERKISDAQKELNSTEDMKASISQMTQAISQLQVERLRSQQHASRIDRLHEMAPRTRYAIQGMADAAISSGGITSLGSLISYLGDGKDLIRDRESLARMLAQKGGYEGSDEQNLKAITETGLQSGYAPGQTALLQGSIIQGGTQDRDKALQDVLAAQQFSRAYSVNPEELASGFGILRKMGTLDEGQMKRFADMIGGSIKANSMNGREEEMIRATTMLISSVSRGMTELSDSQAGNVLALQAALGDAVPTLRGEQGAEVLGGIDAAIKAQDPNGDILLGKGTRFTGIEGYYDLELQKAEGLSNPDNLRTLLTNIRNNFSSPEYQQIVLRDWVNNRGGNMSLPQAKALMESGLWDQIVSGNAQLTQEQLIQYGMADQTQRLQAYDESETSNRQYNEAMREARQLNVADEYEATGTWVMDQFNKLPDGVQKTAIFGGGLLGAGALYKMRGLLFKGYKTFKPPIGGAGAGGAGAGLAGWVQRLLGKKTPTPVPTATAASEAAATRAATTIFGADGKPISTVAEEVLEAGTKNGGKGLMSRLGNWGKGLFKWGGRAAGAAGTVLLADEATDQANNVIDWLIGHQEGQSKNKKLLSNWFKDDKYEDSREGVLKPAADWMVETDAKIKTWFKNLFGGADDTKKLQSNNGSNQNPTAQNLGAYYNPMTDSLYYRPASSNAQSSKQGTATIPDDTTKAWENMWEKSLKEFTNQIEKARPTVTQEQIIKIVVDGKIQGVTPATESTIKDSIKDFFSWSNPNGMYGFMLNTDQKRR